jgi:hypothetical protein
MSMQAEGLCITRSQQIELANTKGFFSTRGVPRSSNLRVKFVHILIEEL